MRPSYQACLKIGAIEIPVMLANVIKGSDSKFKLLDRYDMVKIQYKKYSTHDESLELKGTDIIKGYEYEKDQFVIFSDDEIEALKQGLDNKIKILEFVKTKEIKWYHLHRAYFVLPDDGFIEALAIIRLAMKKTKLVGIGKTILGNKEYLISLKEEQGQLYLYTMQYNEDIYDTSINDKVNINKEHVQMATQIMKLLERPFMINKYHDEYQKRLDQAALLKAKGETIDQVQLSEQDIFMNLTEALQDIITNLSKKKD